MLGIAVLAKWPFAGGRASAVRAQEILKERYAGGDIAKDTFEQMKRDLAA
ncbi:MAG: SHOCT domain-containing protein [Burkholderiales bacterium]